MWNSVTTKLVYSVLLGLLFLLPKNQITGSIAVEAAPEHIVFGVKTEVPMSNEERPRRDFYVNIGTKQGVKIGSVLDVYRSVTSSDNVNNRSSRNVIFKFAKLKVIHAEGDIAVARIVEVLPPNKTPIGDYPSVIVGDRVAIADRF